MEKEKFNKVYEYLNKKGVYELRNIGRALCVRAPTLYKKRELIEQIIENAVSGKVTACLGRGAPVKAERASLQTLSEIRKMVYDVNIKSTEERGMTITINQEEERYLLHCVYLGLLVINGNRKNGEQREEYNEFAEDIYKQVCGKEERITDNELRECAIRSTMKWLHLWKIMRTPFSGRRWRKVLRKKNTLL